MTIDQAYQFCQKILNKDQRGYLKPSDFNLWAPIAQIETISDRLGNVNKVNDRLVPPYGYKMNRKIQNELRPLLIGPVDLIPVSGEAPYPSDYFYIDSIHLADFTPITVLDTDEYPSLKKSVIKPPTSDYPVAVFYGDHILLDPSQTVKWSYIKYPTDPHWDYTIVSGVPVYNSTNTTGVTGVISNNFSVDTSLHLQICYRILKYAGINIDMDAVIQFAKMEETAGA
jgi:hypothetical protein